MGQASVFADAATKIRNSPTVQRNDFVICRITSNLMQGLHLTKSINTGKAFGSK
jgi:hypothetical protein